MLLLVALLGALASPSSNAPGSDARVTPPTTPSAAVRPRGVTVILVGSPPDRAAVHEVLAELLGRIDIDVAWDERDTLDAEKIVRSLDVSDRPDLLAAVVVDLQTPVGLVYVLDAPGDRILVRRIALDAGVDEVAREEIGAITAESIEALLAGGTIGVARREVEEPEPEPEPPPVEPIREPSPAAPAPTAPLPVSTRRARPHWPDTLGITATYRLGAWARRSLQHRLEARLVLTGRRPRVAPRLEVALGAWLPARVGPDVQGIRVVGATGHVAAGLDVRIARATYVVIAGGVGLDVLVLRSRATSGARHLVVPTIDARIGLGWWLEPGVALGLGPFLIADLVDVRILAASDNRVLFDPWRVWPGVQFSVGGFASLIDRRRRGPPRG